jgi:hypothetical protein
MDTTDGTFFFLCSFLSNSRLECKLSGSVTILRHGYQSACGGVCLSRPFFTRQDGLRMAAGLHKVSCRPLSTSDTYPIHSIRHDLFALSPALYHYRPSFLPDPPLPSLYPTRSLRPASLSTLSTDSPIRRHASITYDYYTGQDFGCDWRAKSLYPTLCGVAIESGTTSLEACA